MGGSPFRLAAIIAMCLLAIPMAARAQAPYDDPSRPEGWAWTQIREDQIADFNAKCGRALDPHVETGWDDRCRQISPRFLVDVLIKPEFRDQLPQHGVRLRGVRILGSIDLADAEIKPEVSIEDSRIEGNVVLDGAHLVRLFSLQGSTLTGSLSADRMRTDSAVLLRSNALFEGEIVLTSAKIRGDLDMDRSIFDGYMVLDGAKIGIVLDGAKIGGNLEMSGSTFAAKVSADKLTVGLSLHMQEHASFLGEETVLRNAKIGSNLQIDSSTFAKTLAADGLTVTRLLMDNANFKDEVDLIGAKVGGILELSGDTAWSVDLSGAEAAELQIVGLKWWCAGGEPLTGVSGTQFPLGNPGWRNARCHCCSDPAILPKLVLRNFHVGAFQDNAEAWPPSMDLEGFRYDRLGGLQGEGSVDMRARLPNEWADWLDRDRTFSTQPYTQLSSVLAVAGRRDTADAI